MIRGAEPITVEVVAQSLRLSLDVVESAVAELKSRGVVKRWTDNTKAGRGLTFLGTVNQHGLAEPLIDDSVAPSGDVDPRTVLAIVRRCGTEHIKRITRLYSMPLDGLKAAATALEKQGHIGVERRSNGVMRLSAVDPGWNWY
jgi:hypothetical protein